MVEEPLYCAPSPPGRPDAHAADDAIAGGKVLRVGRQGHRVLGDESFLGDVGGELAVLGGVDEIDPAAEDRDGVAAGLEGGAITSTICR